MPETDWGGTGRGTTGAHCATHLDQPASQTCTRCGNFMCVLCSDGGVQTLCPSCQQRMGVGQGFPLTRANFNFSALWDYCFEIFKRDWLMLGLACLVFFGISMIVQLVANIIPAIGAVVESEALSVILTLVAVIIQSLVQGVLGLGLMRMIVDVLQGGKIDIGRIFSQLHKAGTYFVTILLLILMIGLPVGIIAGIVAGLGAAFGQEAAAIGAGVAVLLGIVPAFYFLLPLNLLQFELACNDGVTPMQAIRNCYAYARGERLSIFGVALVSGLVGLAGVLACCVGMLPAMGLGYMLVGGLYLALRNGAEVERGAEG
jgi:hypothetical protein